VKQNDTKENVKPTPTNDQANNVGRSAMSRENSIVTSTMPPSVQPTTPTGSTIPCTRTVEGALGQGRPHSVARGKSMAQQAVCKTDDQVAKRVEELSNELLENFKQYLAKCVRDNPHDKDKSAMFESWALQKLAGLLAAVLDLEARSDSLEWRSRH
jgi:hypothetical protein